MTKPKNWTSGKTKKLKLWHKSKSEILTKLKKTYVSYLKTENPNLDKTQEIKSRKRIFFLQKVFDLEQFDTSTNDAI